MSDQQVGEGIQEDSGQPPGVIQVEEPPGGPLSSAPSTSGLVFETQRLAGRQPQVIIKITLLSEILMFVEEAIDGLTGTFFRADGSVRADGTALAGEIVQTLSHALVGVDDLVDGDLGAGLRSQLGDARRTTVTARLANATGRISDYMATENFVGKHAELLLTYPGLPFREFVSRFVGEVGNVRLTGDIAQLELRSA